MGGSSRVVCSLIWDSELVSKYLQPVVVIVVGIVAPVFFWGRGGDQEDDSKSNK